MNFFLKETGKATFENICSSFELKGQVCRKHLIFWHWLRYSPWTQGASVLSWSSIFVQCPSSAFIPLCHPLEPKVLLPDFIDVVKKGHHLLLSANIRHRAYLSVWFPFSSSLLPLLLLSPKKKFILVIFGSLL